MPETQPTEPDFLKMAQRMSAPPSGKDADRDYQAFIGQIAEQLRIAWNERGKADAQLFADDMNAGDIRQRIATLNR